jgi:peroxiredoxin
MIRILSAGLIVGLVAATLPAVEVGDKAPDFKATGVDGKEHSLQSVSEGADLVVLCFTCNQCPVAVAYEDRFIEFNKEWEGKKVKFIALNCNNATEGLQAMQQRAEEKGFNFIYAFDESGDAAKAYGARVTPELFVIQNGEIAYHGAYDDDMRNPTKTYVVNAVKSLLAGQTPDDTETRPFGCGIKVK